jgi:hypothetical protein
MTDIETTLKTDVRVERGMILTELGGWVLIDKHENENSKIGMTIMEYLTMNSDFQSNEYRTGQKYTTLSATYKEWKTTDTLLIQQKADKALNKGINGLATTLHPGEEATWYFPRTEYEEDTLIQQERTLRIKDADVAMWADRAFDMGISFSDIHLQKNQQSGPFLLEQLCHTTEGQGWTDHTTTRHTRKAKLQSQKKNGTKIGIDSNKS